jgi:hypothetical protein
VVESVLKVKTQPKGKPQMKIRLILIIAGFIPALVMAQAKPATSLPIEKPIAVNPSEQMYHPKIEDKKQEVKAEVTAKVQAGGINVPVVINSLPGPSGTPKQTQVGDTPVPNVPVVINPLPGPSGTPKQTQVGDTPVPPPEPLCMLYPTSCGKIPDFINAPLGQPEGTKPSEDTQTNTVIFNINNIQHNITHGYQPIIKP